VFSSPYAAPSIAVFGENGSQGRGTYAARFPRGWEAPSENPCQKREAQEKGGIGVSFLLDTFLWTSKEKYLGCRADKSAGQPICRR
jgi:hypothetical protein